MSNRAPPEYGLVISFRLPLPYIQTQECLVSNQSIYYLKYTVDRVFKLNIVSVAPEPPRPEVMHNASKA